MSVTKKISSILFALSLLGQLQAHTIFMRNGDVISGEVIKKEKSTISVKLPDGKISIIKKAKILKINYLQVDNEKILKEKKASNREIEAVEQTPQGKNIAELLEKAGKKRAEKVNNDEAILYSLVLPGLGQYKQGRKLQSAIILPLFLGFAGAAISTRNDYNHKHREYSNSASNTMYPLMVYSMGQLPKSSAYLYYQWQTSHTNYSKLEMGKAGTTADAALGAFLLFYILNIFDVALFNPNASESASLNLFHKSSSWGMESYVNLSFERKF